MLTTDNVRISLQKFPFRTLKVPKKRQQYVTQKYFEWISQSGTEADPQTGVKLQGTDLDLEKSKQPSNKTLLLDLDLVQSKQGSNHPFQKTLLLEPDFGKTHFGLLLFLLDQFSQFQNQ